MDIDLFSDIVKNLIVDNDEVALPGLGTFVSELMPSTFSDKGYTINPPYRRLSFRQRWNEGDTLLLDFYSRTNGTDKETSERIISGFLSGLKEMLQTKKAVQLPGLGRLRATKENTFFFIADEDLDIYPYGFGLEPVSLKSHEETPEEVATAVQELHELVSEPEVPVTVVENGTVPEGQQDQQGSPEGQQHQQDSPDVQKATKGPVNPIAVFLLILAIALVALLVFTIVARLSPGIFDSILYTPEELRIINY